MLELTGLNQQKILVVGKSVFRLTPPRDGDRVTKVEYGGGYLYTDEPLAALLQRLAAEIRIIQLTTRSNTRVYLNAGAISRVREALPLNGSGTEIVVGGQYQHVTESVDQVSQLI